jgi:hypothetical protein
MRVLLCLFCHNTYKMIPWLPWTIVGGIGFITLSFIATKYNNKQYVTKQYLQDFISGSIMVALIGMMMPDIFPSTPQFPDTLLKVISMTDSLTSDIDLQVGPPRLARS